MYTYIVVSREISRDINASGYFVTRVDKQTVKDRQTDIKRDKRG